MGYLKIETHKHKSLKKMAFGMRLGVPDRQYLYLDKNTFFTYIFIKKPKIFLAFTLSSGEIWGGRSVDLGEDAVLDLVAVA
jgi:hypothetical protein